MGEEEDEEEVQEGSEGSQEEGKKAVKVENLPLELNTFTEKNRFFLFFYFFFFIFYIFLFLFLFFLFFFFFLISFSSGRIFMSLSKILNSTKIREEERKRKTKV